MVALQSQFRRHEVCGYPRFSYTEMNPWPGEKLFVEKDIGGKEKQQQVITKQM
jgi:hypothetical protein